MERLVPKNNKIQKSAITIKESLFEMSSELVSLENEEILIDKAAFLNFFDKCEYFRLFANAISSQKQKNKEKKSAIVIPQLNFQVIIEKNLFAL